MQVWKTYETDKYLKYYTCVSSVIDDVVITCDTFVGTPGTVSINHNDKKGACKWVITLYTLFCL